MFALQQDMTIFHLCIAKAANTRWWFCEMQSWAQSPLKRWSAEVRWTVEPLSNGTTLIWHSKKTELNGSTHNIEENNAFSV